MAAKVKMRLGWVQLYDKTGKYSPTSRRCSISRPTLCKWVTRYQQQGLDGLLDQSRRPRKGRKRDHKEIPGERIQRDVGNIGPKLYPCMAIDDCTHLKVIRRYPHQKADRTRAFLEQVIPEFPFASQRSQTDHGEEFIAYQVQYRLMALEIKFRPTKPRSPHRNGKVERRQCTDLEAFYSLVDSKAPD
ncbi:helix-turn-helix domain-containing protein [Candidatus Cyanaurora vandensis]|uniref:helix-turn-helix domain-containing protein n=1 Tax=Candidatus Cyanaurora vandensis TaxID=2714958 RepID=UPI00257CEF95|nr:helix-turn-helix domain-containing protein [Candidatus Cyanaurora vandensis]